MPLLQIKNFFIIIDIMVYEVFQFGWSMSQRTIKCGILKFRGKVCSYFVLSLIIAMNLSD